jgi:hypothetical protein
VAISLLLFGKVRRHPILHLALGYLVTSSSSYATAIGSNSAGNGSQAVTGSGAMALGGSYASGTDSFAAAVANNTASYGARSTGSNLLLGTEQMLAKAIAIRTFAFNF